ncbi:MAG TPA: patatin-like phospholipase family protein [Candidatus Acidoferrales bacterium]|nr:patatin-like phospholipase family protein [Candidatus Acidoferrales bacterium]
MKQVRPKVQRHADRALGLVLSGGGARGAFQVGVYERLLRDPRFAGGPMVLSGTSAGAINAALIAAGKTPREMMAFWNAIADDPPVAASAVFFHTAIRTLLRLTVEESVRWMRSTRPLQAILQRARNHLPPRRGSFAALWVEYLLTTRFELVSRFLDGIKEPFLADTSQLRERLVAFFGGERIPSNGHRLAINTVDAHTGRVVRYVTAETPLTRPPDYIIVDAITVDMVLASASIPLLFPPVQIGPHLLWDGGLLVNTPLAPVVALGAEEIITVLVTEPPDPQPGPFTRFGRAVERTVDSLLENAYNIDRKLLLERNRLARLDGSSFRDVTLYEAVRPARDACFNAGSYLYFERSVLAMMHAAGRRAATAWLAAGPCVDHLEEPAAGVAA